MNVICATEFFDMMEGGADEVGIRDFFRSDFRNFEKFISGKENRILSWKRSFQKG